MRTRTGPSPYPHSHQQDLMATDVTLLGVTISFSRALYTRRDAEKDDPAKVSSNRPDTVAQKNSQSPGPLQGPTEKTVPARAEQSRLPARPSTHQSALILSGIPE